MPFQARVEAKSNSTYDVYTDAPQSTVNQIALEIYKSWVGFALGSSSLGIKPILNPTGKYAKSISIKPGLNKVAIIQDTREAPWGQWLEEGHGEYDFKTDFRGRTFPLHRPGGTYFGKAPHPKIKGYTFTATRSGDMTGFASVGDTGWVIPPMQAYHPAMTLAGMAADKLRSL